MRKGLYERIDEGVLRWFGHVERMERDRITKRVYVGECAGSKQREWSRKGVNFGGLWGGMHEA